MLAEPRHRPRRRRPPRAAIELLTESVDARPPRRRPGAHRLDAAHARRGCCSTTTTTSARRSRCCTRRCSSRTSSTSGPGLTESLETLAGRRRAPGRPAHRRAADRRGRRAARRRPAGSASPTRRPWVQRDRRRRCATALGDEGFAAAEAEGGRARPRRRRRPRAGAQRTVMSARMPCSSWPWQRAVQRVGPRRELERRASRSSPGARSTLPYSCRAAADRQVVVVLAEVGGVERRPARPRACGRRSGSSTRSRSTPVRVGY